ncbi:hypothetical protein RRG08_006192 [Elysia crispata]|uniref:Uncharacterized protein n=1 Tax=Elysia crispata TaxID=231223 RepID=A0AAE1DRE3_9GAST|nr:hypothetical protein RRG08_006192 [Elysia crispata]
MADQSEARINNRKTCIPRTTFYQAPLVRLQHRYITVHNVKPVISLEVGTWPALGLLVGTRTRICYPLVALTIDFDHVTSRCL